METQNTSRNIPWFAILLIIWNILDIVIHVAVDLVEPLRIAGNIVGLVAAVIVLLGLARAYAPHILALAAVAVIGFNIAESITHGYLLPSLLFIGVSVILLVLWTQVEWKKRNPAESDDASKPIYLNWWAAIPITLIGVAIVPLVGEQNELLLGPLAELHDGRLVAADYWREEPMILSAGMGFEGIIGLPEITEDTVREAGGSWYGSVTCTSGAEPDTGNFTSAAPANRVGLLYKGESAYHDGLPIVFSWPVASETVDLTDFQFTLSNGEIIFPSSIGMWPNWELNERNTVVGFADFGNRGYASEEDAIYPVRLDIVEDDTPLLLIGPDGQEFNAVGLSWETDTSPYDSGPVLVGAKLNHVGEASLGEGGLSITSNMDLLPNDEFALYDEGDFRIRILTTGGFSPDGITGVTPNQYEDFFRVHATGADGETVLLEEVGIDYEVAGGTLRVVGLSDLGLAENPDEGIYYDDCYAEDRDNYIDIILVGDEEAARNVTFVEIPATEDGYSPFYNPGGPGPEPFEGIRYTAPGPPDLEPVIIALDDAMRVDREAP